MKMPAHNPNLTILLGMCRTPNIASGEKTQQNTLDNLATLTDGKATSKSTNLHSKCFLVGDSENAKDAEWAREFIPVWWLWNKERYVNVGRPLVSEWWVAERVTWQQGPEEPGNVRIILSFWALHFMPTYSFWEGSYSGHFEHFSINAPPYYRWESRQVILW